MSTKTTKLCISFWIFYHFNWPEKWEFVCFFGLILTPLWTSKLKTLSGKSLVSLSAFKLVFPVWAPRLNKSETCANMLFFKRSRKLVWKVKFVFGLSFTFIDFKMRKDYYYLIIIWAERGNKIVAGFKPSFPKLHHMW